MKYMDLHCDTISAIYEKRQKGMKAELKENTGHIDLVRLKKGGCFGQNFALFTYIKKTKEPYRYGKELLRTFQQELAANPEVIRQAFSTADLLENERNGRMSAILTLEEGAVCEGDPEKLKEFYRAGARMMTLTWNFENELAWPNRIDPVTGAFAPETEHGLKPKGVEFVELMEELGMAVDVSHLGDAGFWDVARVTKKPFLASHSNARAVASHVRNLTDEMIRTLSERGGIMGINFCAAFLNDAEGSHPDGGTSRVADMIRHINHIYQVGGIDCIALGSDFDGIGCRLEMESPAKLSLLWEALERNGFTEEEVEKIFWKNSYRFYREVWRE